MISTWASDTVKPYFIVPAGVEVTLSMQKNSISDYVDFKTRSASDVYLWDVIEKLEQMAANHLDTTRHYYIEGITETPDGIEIRTGT